MQIFTPHAKPWREVTCICHACLRHNLWDSSRYTLLIFPTAFPTGPSSHPKSYSAPGRPSFILKNHSCRSKYAYYLERVTTSTDTALYLIPGDLYFNSFHAKKICPAQGCSWTNNLYIREWAGRQWFHAQGLRWRLPILLERLLSMPYAVRRD